MTQFWLAKSSAILSKYCARKEVCGKCVLPKDIFLYVLTSNIYCRCNRSVDKILQQFITWYMCIYEWYMILYKIWLHFKDKVFVYSKIDKVFVYSKIQYDFV
jgi:hypothetical protein